MKTKALKKLLDWPATDTVRALLGQACRGEGDCDVFPILADAVQDEGRDDLGEALRALHRCEVMPVFRGFADDQEYWIWGYHRYSCLQNSEVVAAIIPYDWWLAMPVKGHMERVDYYNQPARYALTKWRRRELAVVCLATGFAALPADRRAELLATGIPVKAQR